MIADCKYKFKPLEAKDIKAIEDLVRDGKLNEDC